VYGESLPERVDAQDESNTARRHLAHGSSSATPIGLKSTTLRVTTVRRCVKAVAAIKASRSGLGSGTCRAAHRRAMAPSIGRT
jgi:hypothetical protein